MRAFLRTVNGEEYSFGTQIQVIDCFCCGYCCVGYNPQVTDEEIDIMAGYLKISAGEFKSRYIEETLIGYMVRQTETGCVFLNPEENSEKAYCGIHPARPAPCRDWVPSLWRRECREGLARLQKDDSILLVDEMYENDEQRKRFYASLR
ncbi:YkgJ family cysteine cluster protein [Chloroflexota bacterium]